MVALLALALIPNIPVHDQLSFDLDPYAEVSLIRDLALELAIAPDPDPTPPEPEPEPSIATEDVWGRLARCESGGDPRALNPSGRYRGAFQFDLPTWRSVGMSGDPIDHSYAEQLVAAQRLHAARGFHPWPQCARKLGLL